VGLTWASIAWGQPLSELLRKAEARNPALQAQQQTQRADALLPDQAGQLPAPEIGLGGFPLPVETRLGPQLLRVSATQMLPWPGTLRAERELAQLRAQASAEAVSSQRLQLRQAVQSAWLDCYALAQRQHILRRNLALLKGLRKRVESRLAVDQASLAEALQIDVKLNAVQQRLDLLAVQASQPLADLNQLLDHAPDKPLRITDSLELAALPYAPEAADELMQEHPELIRLDRLRQATQQARGVNQQAGKPRFGVGVDYFALGNRRDANPMDNGRDALQLRVNLSLPLYRQKFTAKDQEEALRGEALTWRRREVANQLQSRWAQALAEHEAARLAHEFARQQSDLLRRTLALLETDYSAGRADFEALLRLQMELIDYDLQVLDAVVQSHRARIALDALVPKR